MIKKRAMHKSTWSVTGTDDFTIIIDEFHNQFHMKRLETGYAENQPKWPYWVKPHNYSDLEWWAIDDWMVETFGDSDWLLDNAPYIGSDQKYWFRKESDRTFFLLRWS
jgi:hypothetical protein